MIKSPFEYQRNPQGFGLSEGWQQKAVICDIFEIEGKLGTYRVLRPHSDDQESGPNVLQCRLVGEDYFRHVYTFERSRNLEWSSRYINSCEKAGKLIHSWEESLRVLPPSNSGGH